MTVLPYLFIVLCGLAFLAGVPLNDYILFVASYRIQRTASAVWFLNRAVSNLIFILCLPLRFVFIYFLHFDWVRRLSSIVTSLHIFSSVFLLAALSVHRCVLVAQPGWSQKCHTASLAFWVGLGPWTLFAGFSLWYSDLWESFFSHVSTNMYFDMDEDKDRMKAIVIQFLVGFLIPLALNLIPVFYIIHATRLGRNRLIQDTQPLKVLLGLTPTFFLCWLPYHVFFFLWISAPYPQDFLATDSTFPYFLMYFNCCLNPIFYLTMEEEFLRYRQHTPIPHATDHSGPEPAE